MTPVAPAMCLHAHDPGCSALDGIALKVEDVFAHTLELAPLTLEQKSTFAKPKLIPA